MPEEFKKIGYAEAVAFLLPRHYSGRKPSISYAFGLFEGGSLSAVCTFGKPASMPLCDGVCGKDHRAHVYELNRLCRTDEYRGQISRFVGWCLREISRDSLIIVSYSDTEMHHHGYIYQACNFIYTGKTKPRTDKYTEGNKHCRHYDKKSGRLERKARSEKHRYVFFATRNKKQKAVWRGALRYPVLAYPKGDNQKYILGSFLQPRIITGVKNA